MGRSDIVCTERDFKGNLSGKCYELGVLYLYVKRSSRHGDLMEFSESRIYIAKQSHLRRRIWKVATSLSCG